MKRCRRPLALIPLLAVAMGFLALHGDAQPGQALLWKVTAADLPEPSYLFGTYHLLTDTYFHSLVEAKAPFAGARGVVVETRIDSARLPALVGHMIMPDKKLSELLTAADFLRVSDELNRQSGMTLAQLNQMKPATVALLLTMAYAQRGNGETLARYPGKPIDYHLAAAGKKLAKAVTELETMEEQFGILYNTFSVEEQARQLVALVDQKELAATAQVKLLELYLGRDLAGLYAYADQLPDEFGTSDMLLKKRNEKWMNVLPDLMKRGSQFIAVGALHLPGPEGLIALLRQAGYTVTPVTP